MPAQAPPRKTPPPPPFDPEIHAAAMAPMLGLSLDPAWRDAIAKNLAVLAAAADLVGGFALPDEAEAAPIFGA